MLTYLQDQTTPFPDVTQALIEPDGLLAIGGDLSHDRLISAYQQGIFPWFNPQDKDCLWWSPSERAVILPEQFKPHHSLIKYYRRFQFKVTINYDFAQVIEQCALTRGEQKTWITPAIRQSYCLLHQQKKAHSVEVWQNNQLIGGLYGIEVGRLFCGESMFSTQTNASKIAFWSLCQHFSQNNGQLIDCQMITPHLLSLGVFAIPRHEFINKLKTLRDQSINPSCFLPQIISLL